MKTIFRGLFWVFVIFALTSAAYSVESLANPTTVRVSMGFGLDFLPIMMMKHDGLLQKRASTLGLKNLKAEYRVIDGAAAINDALLSGSLDFATVGVPGFITIWAKTQGTSREVKGVAAVSSFKMNLSTRNPNVKTVADFTPNDRIAVPSIKASIEAVLLEMAAAQQFGDANYAKLDPLTVAIPFPEALAIMLSGKGQITSHFASPPFSYLELKDPKIHSVLSSTQILGGNASLTVTYTTLHFHNAHPKAYEAFVLALGDAMREIQHDKKRAAEVYLGGKQSKFTVQDIITILADPDNTFSMEPQNVMKYANFLFKVERIKKHPASVHTLFFSNVKNGS